MPLNPDQQAKFKTVCERIANGMSLVAICKDKKMPCYSLVQEWLQFDETGLLVDMYARAREAQADHHADILVALADAAKTSEEVAAANLQINTRKWVASKLKARVYGDKQEVKHTGDVNVTVIERFTLPNAKD